jgi:hypothetical protein
MLKKIYFILLFIFIFTLKIDSSNAVVAPSDLGLPVGGFIDFFNICPAPVYHINFGTTVGKTGKEPGAGLWSYIPAGTFLYDYGPPKRLEQAVLGMAATDYLPCYSKGTLLTPPVKLGPGGPTVTFMGSNL